ncbi:MAG: hypothetical protein KIS68_03675 [Bauldia sp.]|nr:hypothetical protein [Bauldia sp.]
MPVYRTNPSVPGTNEIARIKRVQIGDDHKGFVVDRGTGEILGRGGAISYEFEEVDKERFVKLYLAGLKQASDLSKAGMAVFEIVYNELRGSPGRDTVLLSQDASPLAPATFRRGLRELLEKEFLFRSPYDGTFFVNIRFMFNGDRLAFVKGYRLKNAEAEQASLPLALPEPVSDARSQ